MKWTKKNADLFNFFVFFVICIYEKYEIYEKKLFIFQTELIQTCLIYSGLFL